MMNDDRPAGETEVVVEADAPVSTTALESELAQARARADENYEKFLLARADLDNFKKRTERTFSDRVTYERYKTLRAFLPVLDNLLRALSYDDGNADGVRGGLEQTLKGFENVLAMEGVKPIDVMGRPFDPAVAEAIATQPAEGVADDTVVQEVERGYRAGDELLRPAKVIVAKAASSEA